MHNPVCGTNKREIVDGRDRIVVKESDVPSVVRAFYVELKGSGTRRIKHQIDEYFSGVSEKLLFKLLRKNHKDRSINQFSQM